MMLSSSRLKCALLLLISVIFRNNNGQTQNVQQLAKQTRCLVSDLIDPFIDGYETYPRIFTTLPQDHDADLFSDTTDKSIFKDAYFCPPDPPLNKLHKTVEDSICFPDEGDSRKKGEKRHCPVTLDDIDATISVNTWPIKISSFCNLVSEKTKGNLVNEVRIIILGGSEALGTYTQQQCCLNHHPPFKKCAANNGISVYEEDSYLCNWSGYFTRWLRVRFPHQKFKVINLSQGGTASDVMSREVQALFDDHNISALSSNDFVFLDHSSNDLMYAKTVFVELLLRKIYEYSIKDAPPTIVFLEQVPRCFSLYNDKHDPNELKHIGDSHQCYIQIYRQLAQHYKLPIFSYYNAIWSEKANKNRPPILQHILTRFELHHPYSSHLYMADMLAGFTEEIISSRCTMNATESTMVMQNNLYHKNRSGQVINLSPPIPINQESIYQAASATCMIDRSQKSYLSHYLPINKLEPKDLPIFEMQLKGWTEYLDHHRPGWIINKYATGKGGNDESCGVQGRLPCSGDPDGRIDPARLLYFRHPLEQLKKLNPSTNILIQVTYLKSYEDAGTFSLMPCGVDASFTKFGLGFDRENNMTHGTQLDAMFLFGSRKVSIPDTFNIVMNVSEILSCPVMKPSLLSKSVPDANIGAFFGIYYEGRNTFTRQEKMASRKNYKVKILSVIFCVKNDNYK